MPDFAELKKKHQATWASGDYKQIGNGILSVADHLVRCARIRSGERVLDLACGTGNTTLMARARNAIVTGLDLTPELLEIAKERAVEDGFDDIAWQAGDVENIPFPDASFDVVVSSCGLMFAPDQQKVADEVARVTKPGGRIAIHAWTLEGGIGRMFGIVGKYVTPMAGVPSPFNWGNAEKAQALLGESFQDYRFERYDCPEFGDSPERMADLYIDRYGPTYKVYNSLTPEKAAEFRNDLIELYRGSITPIDGKIRWGREYLITLATRI